jgi:hypothetical protein
MRRDMDRLRFVKQRIKEIVEIQAVIPNRETNSI